jgi:NAD(P)-dependent dehydrogenase (short-subunit alcohol dehydrogenase family)
MDRIEGRVAVVTGAASGIGLATARLLAARGAAVEAIDRTPHSADGAQAGIRWSQADVSDEDAVAARIADVESRHGRIDIVVTAAGIQRYGTATGTSAEQWREVMAVNLDGAFHVVRHALPALRASGHGSIVLVSSVQAFVTQTGVAAYTASKGALNAFARSLAVDEAPFGVRANAVCPGSVDTPMLRASARDHCDGTDEGVERLVREWGLSHPLGRVANPDEVAEAIAFLASDRASFVTGIALPVDGGLLAKVAVALPSTSV